MTRAMKTLRSDSFPQWYLDVVAGADLAVNSPVRGCMIIRPNGYGIWERIQAQLDARFVETGHENLYFPLFIPLSFIAKEAEHAEGFAQEMAVVTHYRLKNTDGKLAVDPEAKLHEPLIIRPTSETIIGAHFKDCVNSYRDLPLLWNQWANVVRWEMRTRLFLRTAEFLWQEGHTAHADKDDAMAETMRMLEVYRSFAEEVLAMPVIAGEKPPHERFAGACNTYSIEAMMQDGKALQAGTSHYLGTNFAKAQEIKYQSKEGKIEFCHTTSWGVSTRLIGGVVMSHSDDDGLRAPPRIAPKQIVIVPILRGKDEDKAVLDFCAALRDGLRKSTYAGEPLRVHVDARDARPVDKRWEWIKKGVPLICEIGGRDASGGVVTFYRRDQLRNGEALSSKQMPAADFTSGAAQMLTDIQAALYADAKALLDKNIVRDVHTLAGLKDYFGAAVTDEDGGDVSPMRGWVLTAWKRPATEMALLKVQAELKALRISIRNTPLGVAAPSPTCIFSGEPAEEAILIARSY